MTRAWLPSSWSGASRSPAVPRCTEAIANRGPWSSSSSTCRGARTDRRSSALPRRVRARGGMGRASHGTFVGDVIDDDPLAHSTFPMSTTFARVRRVHR